jgi:hypothetical protein
MAAHAQIELQEAEVKKEIEKIELPKGVRLKSVFFDTDYSGDAAIYVVFAVSKHLGLGAARIRALGELRFRVSQVVDGLNSDRLNYVRFVDVK